MILALLLGCPPAPPPAEVHFVRGGLVKDGVYTARAWTPGESVEGSVAPIVPECVPLFSVELEDMDRLAAMNAPAPGATLAFSPDGAWLAIGSDAGSLRVVDATTGAERGRRQLAEGAVKQVTWSADAGTLYVGGQSPDAELLAVDPATLATRWEVHLSEDLQTSALPPADDVYGIYSLPAVLAIRLLDGGDLLVAGSHGWVGSDGVRQNRGRIYRYGPDGTRRGAWPADGPARAVLLHPAVHGDRALVGVGYSADGPPPTDVPVDGVAALDLSTMTLAWQHVFPPLAPYFTSVYLWEAAGISDSLALAGMGDGRAFLFGPDGTLTTTLSPGVPVLSQGIPIAAGVGFGTVVDDTAYFLTTSTNIPWGSADPHARPPSAHPAQYTLHAVGADGVTRWTWHGEHALEGIAVSPDGAALVVAAAERTTDTRADLYGALIFDRATGALVTTCATEGPAYFRPTFAADGRLAVSESAFAADASLGGAVQGAYRVTVFR